MKRAIFVAALGAVATAGSLARAQAEERPPPREAIPAPRNALELSVGSGYTQGFGNLQSGVGIPSVAKAGVSADLGVGYRIDPWWALLVAAQYQELTPERANGVRGLTTSLAAQYHFTPLRQLDPWVEVGVGYRLLWEDPFVGPTVLVHGLQAVRARAGLDVRMSEHLALGPVIGLEADVFLFQDAPNVATNIDEPRASMFIHAGLQGRFDVGRTTSTASRGLAKR